MTNAQVACVRAPNPGPMTLEGTNTWIVSGDGGAVVVDPGPDDEGHLAAVLEAAGPVRLALLTHGHADHSAGAVRFADLAGCPVRAYDERFCVDAPPLREGEILPESAGGLRVLHVPGHTADSVAFLFPAAPGSAAPGSPSGRASDTGGPDDVSGVLLAGDTVLGRGTTVVAHPDGALGPYLESLRRLLRLADDGAVRRLLPGHGPVVEKPRAVLDYYLEHRAERLAQVEAALRAGARSDEDVVRTVYADVDPSLWPAAGQSVRAQLDYLEQHHEP